MDYLRSSWPKNETCCDAIFNRELSPAVLIVREAVGELVRAGQWAIFGQIRTRELRYSGNSCKPSTLHQSSYREMREVRSNPVRVASLVNERVYSHAINRWALAAFGHFLDTNAMRHF
jgi:hypothetical protein